MTGPIRIVEDERIPMRDGSWLAANRFLPAGPGPHPAVLELLPYRKDARSEEQARPHRHFAAHGYVSVQLDCRGTGASPGAITDEYTEREQQDAHDACAWLAAQPWCTGAVGAFGLSYGGYTACQLAASRAPALRAIAPMCGFDDRYTDDCHYGGGQLRMYDVGRYGNRMLAMNALPPTSDPADAEWMARWRERLERSEPWYPNWIAHQADGPYWRRGSIRERVEEIDCAVLLWGGWADGYTNAILRMFPRLRGPKRAIVGPWMHTRPDVAIPGPRIDWLRETTRWWDQWLKGLDTGVADEPPVALYVQSHDPPASRRPATSGYWRAEAALPVPSAADEALHLGDDGTLAAAPVPGAGRAALEHRATAGTAGGEFSAGGLPDFGLALDQRLDEPYAVVHTGAPLTEPLEIAGRPRLVLHVASSAPVALVCARLCDVAPGGASALVAKGALNLTRRASLTAPEPLEPGVVYEIELELDATAWRFAPGHRLRLMLLTSDFPSLWPTPEPAVLTVHRGGARDSRLVLPRIALGDPARPTAAFAPPPALGDEDGVAERRQEVVRDALEDAVEVRMGYAATAQGGDVQDRRELSLWVSDRDPAHARAWGRTTMALRGAVRCEVEATTTVTSSAAAFRVAQRLRVTHDGAPLHERAWEHELPRLLL